ncbi:DUF4233 domain-containing protein [Microbacterium rhizomatis]|uniref:DUF4233 domain-containing protein n=1 Tax=Microbacterium rhizomatis TaxID=1631477 RepID=A0A5J5J2Y5_9MICO|nr:DUF4233 domain-containing protein [Microbacterium rhizomatis]KAA9110431.1 DUF4233 domain-containing protein [Microbacterium rhizomatis]
MSASADPADPTGGADAPKPRRPRRARGAAESLGSIVLAAEAVIVFLGGLVVFGLRALPDAIEPWWGVVGGTVLAIVMLLTGGVLRHRWGIVLGWVLQVIVALAAFLVPAFLIVALIFGGMWAYATIKGASLDARNARLAQDPGIPNGD